MHGYYLTRFELLSLAKKNCVSSPDEVLRMRSLKNSECVRQKLQKYYNHELLGYNVLDCEMLFVPVCINFHWVAIVVNLKEKRFEWLDSLSGRPNPRHNQFLRKLIEALCIMLKELDGGDRVSLDDFNVVHPQLPKQDNGYDCGVFLIKYLKSWDGAMPLTLNAVKMDKYRFKIVAAMILDDNNAEKANIVSPHMIGIRRCTVNSFGYIAKGVGPQDVLATLLINLKCQWGSSVIVSWTQGHLSPELANQSTPPAEQPKPKSRKRKQLFEESTVLSNKFMKKALEDSHDLLRKRRNIPCSILGVWKLKNRLRKEQMFLESSITEEAYSESSVAQSQDPVPDLDMETERLRQYEADASSNVLPHFAPSPPAFMPSPRVAHSGDPVPDLDVEIEHLRQYEADASSNVLPQLVPLPSAFMPTSFRREDFTPISNNNLGLGLGAQGGTTIGTVVLPTPALGASTEPLGSDMEKPMTFLEERLGVGNTGLSDIHEMMNSAGTEELNFLEADNNTPTDMKENFLGHPEGGLRLLSRLVLKSYGLVDVQQDEPYGGITLKLTPTLKAQF
ncbi:hypothetical protein L1049_017126 [Liquidambar formosana]|uniref:Ubiquitin-like protease family profile domain-containing protein n=1 Tax=Liquidambar formosana TaxID=63359 RepID=A0AAP0S7D6_LIQFO